MKPLVSLLLSLVFAGSLFAQEPAPYPPVPEAIRTAELVDMDGKSFTLESYKDKVVLLVLWGSWVGPSFADMPDLVSLQKEFGDARLQIIGVNIGDGSGATESKELIKRFARKHQINFRLVTAQSGNSFTNECYKLTGYDVVPQTLMIGRGTVIRGVFIGGGSKTFKARRETLEKALGEQ